MYILIELYKKYTYKTMTVTSRTAWVLHGFDVMNKS